MTDVITWLAFCLQLLTSVLQALRNGIEWRSLLWCSRTPVRL